MSSPFENFLPATFKVLEFVFFFNFLLINLLISFRRFTAMFGSCSRTSKTSTEEYSGVYFSVVYWIQLLDYNRLRILLQTMDDISSI